MTARQNHATVSGVKALRGWEDGSAYKACYDRSLPLDAMVGVAGVDARNLEKYFISRDILGKLFVWAQFWHS